jgi:hypothetical protein
MITTPKDRAVWNSILNAFGFGLVLTFWSGMWARIARIERISEDWSPVIADVSEMSLIAMTIAVSAILAASQHTKLERQVRWLKGTTFPYWCGVAFAFLYLIFIGLSMPVFGNQFISLR